jgi:PAS domain S-box-containing protein
MPSLKVGLVCRGERLPELSRMIGQYDFLTLAGVVDLSGSRTGDGVSQSAGYIVLDNIDELMALEGLQFIVKDDRKGFETAKTNSYTPFGVIELGAGMVKSFFSLVENHRELMQLFRDMELMKIILNNVQEGIQYANGDGELRYVNPAYTRITGIDPKERIGTNVFTMSRDGALARALETKRPVFGLRNTAVNSKTEVVSNASPVFDGDDLLGAVVAFRDISDIIKLSRELKQSNELIASLNSRLEQYQRQKFVFNDIICSSETMLALKAKAKKIALSDSTVLIQGESGTGKELFAHAIHHASSRSTKPFVEVNCAAIPENLLESELFGHEKGAFTGADRRKPGRFEMAGGGTIFLDEIGELKHEMQAKLLRVLQNKEYERVGGTRTMAADVRVIAATNRNLREMMARGEFREDLFYRLHVLHLVIPPLRQRAEDVPVLARHLLKKISARVGITKKGIHRDALNFLKQYSWPGNIRELENLLERVVYYEEGDFITLDSVTLHLEPFIKKGVSDAAAPVCTLGEAEGQAIKRALDYYGRTVEGKRKAGRALGISLATLYNKINKHRIE